VSNLGKIPAATVPVWEHRYPGRFQFELDDLKDAGIEPEIDKNALAQGILILEFNWPLDKTTVRLKATFPDTFPRNRPIVNLIADQSDYPERHCSPIDGNVCLLGRDSRQWEPRRLTLRRLLDEQLADALQNKGEEDPQGEPAEFWWNMYGKKDSYCLIDSAWNLEGVPFGTLKIHYTISDTTNPVIQGIVMSVLDENKQEIEKWTGPVPQNLASRSVKKATIPWVRVDGTFMPTGDLGQFKKLVLDNPQLQKHSPTQISSNTQARWFAVLYQSELTFGKMGDGWLFPFIHGSKKDFSQNHKGRQPTTTFIRTYRAGNSDIGARVPSVAGLRNKKIAVFGIGAIGAPLAVDLARNGAAKLHLTEYDVLEPGNSIRWPIGASSWGQDKLSALTSFIEREYPWTEIVPHSHCVGTVSGLGDQVVRDETIIGEILNDVDLVIDATTSFGVTMALHDYCQDRGLPQVVLFASPTVEGGVVARYGTQGGCPNCLEYAWKKQDIDKPPGMGDDTGLQQPPGCSEVTFTGASFDLQELSLQAARIVVDTLSDPDGAKDSVIQTLSFVNEEGQKSPPGWKTKPLPAYPECSCRKST
jgi:hypothetical protein